MKNIGLAVLLFVLLGTAEGAESVRTGDLERVFLACRHVGDPTVADDLRSLAAKRGASDAEMRQRMKKALSEFGAKNPSVVSRERLDAWISELERP